MTAPRSCDAPQRDPGALGITAVALLRRFDRTMRAAEQNIVPERWAELEDIAAEARLLLGMIEIRDHG